MKRCGTCYQVANVGLRVGVDSPELLDHADALLGRFRMSRCHSSQVWTLNLRYGRLTTGGDRDGTRRIWSGMVPPGFAATNYAGPEYRRLELTGLGRVEVDLRRRRAVITLRSPDQAQKSGYFLMAVLCAGLTRSGHFPLHAACLAMPTERGFRGVLIVARSGTGKSTTSFALTSAGWKLMGDDLALLCRTEQGLAVWGYPRVCHVRRPTLDLLPWLRELPLRRSNLENTSELPFAALGDRGFGPQPCPLKPAMVLVLERPNGTGHRCERLDPVSALAAICQENVQPIEGCRDVDARETFASLADLVRQTPAYLLSVGPKLDSIGDFLLSETGAGQ